MMNEYHYRECGLDNVVIKGMSPCMDDNKCAVVSIPNITGLHRSIAAAIVGHDAGISGKELRFLRTEMGMTQAELAKVVHHDTQSVGRWEREEHPMEPAAEALIRLLAIEQLNLEVKPATILEVSKRCIPTAGPQPITIDGEDPNHYKVAA
jgi:DNA-binding transcriptional regulator YiaG